MDLSPYLTDGPTLVSFSGGRTSAYMLHQVIAAHGGTLPGHVVVTFANTGKEREETLRFVYECGSQWGVRIHWLERRAGGAFEEVGYNRANRDGTPFRELIDEKGYLPNAVTRFCTSELKIRVMRDFAQQVMGWSGWLNMVGLRYDEGHRVLRMYARNDERKDPWTSIAPLAKAKVTKRDVLAFWKQQPFDLALESYEGNCDMCFLKSRGALKRLIRDNPDMAAWWKDREASIGFDSEKVTAAGARFVTEYRYADLEREVVTQPFMPGLLEDDEECGAEDCGVSL